MELKEVFEPVLNFIKKLQKKDIEIASKQAAKDRLKLVLMQDRASVSPDFFELMKQEIIDVIKKYIEIDEESLEVQLTRGIEAGLEGPALYANIPIKNVKPVAPKGEGDEEETIEMTEEKADEIAEQILNQIENVGTTLTEDAQESENKSVGIDEHIDPSKATENPVEADVNGDLQITASQQEIEDKSKSEEQPKTKKTSTTKKTATKTTTKKTTSTKTKKDSKK